MPVRFQVLDKPGDANTMNRLLRDSSGQAYFLATGIFLARADNFEGRERGEPCQQAQRRARSSAIRRFLAVWSIRGWVRDPFRLFPENCPLRWRVPTAFRLYRARGGKTGLTDEKLAAYRRSIAQHWGRIIASVRYLPGAWSWRWACQSPSKSRVIDPRLAKLFRSPSARGCSRLRRMASGGQ